MNILKAIAGAAATALILIAATGCRKDDIIYENRKVLLFYEICK